MRPALSLPASSIVDRISARSRRANRGLTIIITAITILQLLFVNNIRQLTLALFIAGQHTCQLIIIPIKPAEKLLLCSANTLQSHY